jgi:hypothetical protein
VTAVTVPDADLAALENRFLLWKETEGRGTQRMEIKGSTLEEISESVSSRMFCCQASD